MCADCAAFAADGLPFAYAEALCQQGRQLSQWWREWRDLITTDFAARRGWKTFAGRGRGPQLTAELEYWEKQQHPYFRMPHHRREAPPGHLLLYILCCRTLWLLEHLRANGQDHHLLRAGAPPWMLRLVKPVRARLGVSAGRWSIVREAVTRQAVAAWLSLKSRTVQRKLYNPGRINEELADSRARSQEGFAFFYAMATPVERRWLLQHSAYGQCQSEDATFSVRAPDGIAYFRPWRPARALARELAALGRRCCDRPSSVGHRGQWLGLWTLARADGGRIDAARRACASFAQ